MVSPSPLPYHLLDNNFILLPQKALYWEEQQILIIADVHLGKVGHFRKSGIAIPRSMEQEDLAMLSDLIRIYSPKQLIFLGDLFHSEINNDWDWFVLWRQLFKKIPMTLVRGNHDILHDDLYMRVDFTLVTQMQVGPFLFLHEPLKASKVALTDKYVISGHIHPGVRLRGKGRQSITLPCFHFGKKQAVLPAFGRFTGKYCIKHEDTDTVFGIIRDKVILL